MGGCVVSAPIAAKLKTRIGDSADLRKRLVVASITTQMFNGLNTYAPTGERIIDGASCNLQSCL